MSNYQKVRLTQDFMTTINGKAKAGVEGYIVCDWMGYSILFVDEDPRLIESGNSDGQFMLNKVPGHYFVHI